MRTTVQNNNDEVIEIRSCWDEKEANELLSTKKWKLLHGGVAHKDTLGYQARPCFVLGRIE